MHIALSQTTDSLLSLAHQISEGDLRGLPELLFYELADWQSAADWACDTNDTSELAFMFTKETAFAIYAGLSERTHDYFTGFGNWFDGPGREWAEKELAA